MSDTLSFDPSTAVALIGMSGRIPGAVDVREFWRNLCGGVESIGRFSDDELLAAGEDPALLARPDYVKAGAVVDGADTFASGFFGMSAREAEITDPQHRVFFECAWEALEDAGYAADAYPGRIAVYAGSGLNTYMIENLLPNAGLLQTLGVLPLLIGNKADFMASMVSYKLGLRGESVSVGTACSTSLVAVHMACRSLLAYECDMALAGGVSIVAAQRRGYLYQPGGVYSPDGHCRAFDAGAQGTVAGNGAGVVVLKRLDEALADGDTVVAVIRASAVNNDGAAKVGYTAPGVAGQRDVIAQALALAEVPASSIGYVETHGTGTTMGDPIEVRALADAFGAEAGAAGSCAIGSVKPNIGHLDAAAGVAGLIKVALCLQHRMLVPSINHRQPNPAIEFAATPFYVNTLLRPWEPLEPGLPRRAGVSSFGIGGTNVHAVLEEAPAQVPGGPSRRWQVLPLSAGSAPALEQATTRLADRLRQEPSLVLADVAYTLQVGRKAFAQRRVVLAREGGEAVTVLGQPEHPRQRVQATRREAPSLVLMFPGIGDHYPGMGWNLYQEEPVLREQLDRCAELLRPRLGIDIRDLLFPARHGPAAESAPAVPAPRLLIRRAAPATAVEDALRRTEHLHPALFALEYALARQWIDWLGTPAALIGYSLGEYTAACVAGVMSLEDALMLVCERARLIQALPAGRMLAVALPEAALRARLTPALSLAAVNGPSMSVVAGEPDAVAALGAQLAAQGVAHLPVQSGHAFHSHMLSAIEGPLQALFGGVALHAPVIPYISNRTGDWTTDAQATDAAHWARHTIDTVRFADGLATLAAEPQRVFLEVGPGQTLCSLLHQLNPAQALPAPVAQCSLPAAHDAAADASTLARALGWAWCQGLAVDWAGYHAGRPRRRVSLPSYPFERQRHWIDRPAAGGAADITTATAPDDAPRLYRSTWTSRPQSARPPASALQSPRPWLLFEADAPLSRALSRQLEAAGQRVLRVMPGPAFVQHDAHTFTLDPARAKDHDALARALQDAGQWPERVLHLWALDTRCAAAQVVASTGHLFAALGAHAGQALALLVLARGTQQVAGDEPLDGVLGLQLAVCRVGSLESPHVASCHIDLAPMHADADAERCAAQVLGEFGRKLNGHVELALRGMNRWQRGPAAAMAATASSPALLVRDGRYLVHGYTGGGRSAAAAELAAVQGASTLVLATLLPIEDAAVATAEVQIAREHLRVLRASGARVSVLTLSPRDPVPPSLVVALREGARLDGCFVVPPDRSFALLNQTDVEPLHQHVLQPLRSLIAQLREAGAGFVALLVTHASVAGGVGRVGDCAASVWSQSLAWQSTAQGGTPVLQVAVELRDDPTSTTLPGSLPIGVGEALEAARQPGAIERAALLPMLVQALAAGEPELLICAGSAARAVDSLRDANLPKLVQLAQAAASTLAARPGFEPPASDFEAAVVEIWCELFRAERIGAHDNFFALGGNSLLAVQFFTRLRTIYQVELPLRALFQSPTVRAIAGELENSLLAELENLSDEEVEAQTKAALQPAPEVAAARVAPTHYVLPNGLSVRHFNPVETDHFYRDIFESKVYHRNGITFDDGAVVFDIGANIGLFSLYASRQCRSPLIHAFEPAPPVFQLLQDNLRLNGVDAQLHNCGVADEVRTQRLTFYPLSTGMSSFHADKAQEKEVLHAIMSNQLRQGMPGMGDVMEWADQILEERFREQSFDCPMVTVSEVIRRERLQWVDLMKIDVQKSELEVLQGIEPAHWPLIRQIVIEVHDLEGRVDQVAAMLRARGYTVTVEQELLYRSSNISNLYALRR